MSSGNKQKNWKFITSVLIILLVFILGIISGFVTARKKYSHILDLVQESNAQGLERAAIIGKLTGNSVKFSKPRGFGSDLQDAMDAALASTTSASREYQAEVLIQGLEIGDLNEVLKYVESLPADPRREMALNLLMKHWGQLDGRSAIAYAQSATTYWQRGKAIIEALRGWSISSPADAWNWALTNPGPDLFRSERINVVLMQIADQDPETAFSLAMTIPDEAFTASALENICNQFYAQGELERMLELVDVLPYGIVRRLIKTHVAMQWSQYEPQKAADWAGLIDDSVTRSEAIQGVVQVWTALDPLSALNWIESLDANMDKQKAFAEAIVGWINLEGANAPAEWLNKQPLSPEFDESVKEVALHIMEDDGDAAMEWAESITDEDLRQLTTNMILARWGQGNKIIVDETIVMVDQTTDSPVSDGEEEPLQEDIDSPVIDPLQEISEETKEPNSILDPENEGS